MRDEQEKYPHKNLGNKLKVLRGEKKQYRFAKDLGIAVTTYNRYEKGRKKIPDGLFRLAGMLAQKNNKGSIGSTVEYDKEKRSYMVPDISLSYGPETDNLLQMAREVLESGSEYGWSLAANIRSFYNAVKIDKELEKYKKDLSDYEKRLAALESICAANHPGALKKEGAM